MNWNSPGDLLILFAFGLNLLVGFAFYRMARDHKSFEGLARKSYRTFVVCVGLAVAYLFYLIFSHNFAIKYVAEYSDRSLEFFYLVSSLWAGQEGTYLLWLFFSTLFGYVIIKQGGIYKDWGMVVFSLVNLFFLFILVRLSPFALADVVPADGYGLNPLLQDPWMVIHPPVIFVGYAAAGVPFALAMAALIINDYSDWVRRVFPWVAVTALMIGMGNILGAYWAYKTLGWGGYWGWDPVENSSLIPWFASLALIHGLLLEKRTKGALRKTNLLLSALTFILVVYGTFLTRSGVLADFSVHSFVNLGTNIYLVGFLIAFVVLTVALFAPRLRSIGNVPIDYNFYGREFTLVAATALLFAFAMIVLFWSSLPFLTSVFTDEPRAADVTTYNDFALPLAIVYSLILAISPLTRQDNFRPSSWPMRLVFVALAAMATGVGLFFLLSTASLAFVLVFGLVATGMVMYVMKPDWWGRLIPSFAALAAGLVISVLVGVREPLYLMLFSMASMAAVTNLTAAFDCLPNGWRSMAGHLTHFGFGIMVIGVLASSAFATSEQLTLTTEEGGSSYGVRLEYLGMANDIMHPKNELILTLDDGDGSHEVRPQLYYSPRLDGIMKRPHIERYWLNDLYLAPQQIRPAENGGLQITKGETHEVQGYHLTFLGFDMGNHGGSTEDLRVATRFEVEHEGTIDTITPTLIMTTDELGNPRYISEPAYLDSAGAMPINIERILADQGAVLLDITGLDTSTPEVLVLDVTRKPMILLVWIGTTIVLLGCVVSFARRRKDLS